MPDMGSFCEQFNFEHRSASLDNDNLRPAVASATRGEVGALAVAILEISRWVSVSDGGQHDAAEDDEGPDALHPCCVVTPPCCISSLLA